MDTQSNDGNRKIFFSFSAILLILSLSIPMDVLIKSYILTNYGVFILVQYIAETSNISYLFFPNQIFFPISNLLKNTILASIVTIAMMVVFILISAQVINRVGYIIFFLLYIFLSVISTVALLVA